MKVGDLIKLAPWCKDGPALMQVAAVDVFGFTCFAIFLEGPRLGEDVFVSPGNIFSLVTYDISVKGFSDRMHI